MKKPVTVLFALTFLISLCGPALAGSYVNRSSHYLEAQGVIKALIKPDKVVVTVTAVSEISNGKPVECKYPFVPGEDKTFMYKDINDYCPLFDSLKVADKVYVKFHEENGTLDAFCVMSEISGE